MSPASILLLTVLLGALVGCSESGLLSSEDGLSTVSVRAVSLTEGDAVAGRTTAMLFTLSLDRVSTQAITVDYATSDITAVAASDYEATQGSATITSGTLSTTVTVPIIGDTILEMDETLLVTLSNPSSFAKLSSTQQTAIGTIINDEAAVIPSIAAATVAEGDGAAGVDGSVLIFTLTLDHAADHALTLSYATSDGTASGGANATVVGADYVTTSGTLSISALATSATISVPVIGDLLFGATDETLTLSATLTDPTTGTVVQSSAVGTIINDDLLRLNDTGISRCMDASGALGSCPHSSMLGQDGEMGRDVTIFEVVNDGHAGFQFTKLNSSGVALTDQSATTVSGECLRDEQTGLVWELKTNNGGLQDRDWEYSWYQSNIVGPDELLGHQAPTNANCGGLSNCNSEVYAAAINGQAPCGFSDWRLPSVDELLTIINGDSVSPALDSNYFPNHGTTALYWSNNSAATPIFYGWYVDLATGSVGTVSKDQLLSLRLVRGARE